jgi:hypothetical protein
MNTVSLRFLSPRRPDTDRGEPGGDYFNSPQGRGSRGKQ